MSKWIWKLADNGWADWICPECGWRYNDDIHVTLDYKYCPMCGKYLGGTSEIDEVNNMSGKRVYVISYYDNLDNKEPIITVWDNPISARSHIDHLILMGYKPWLDKTYVYTQFIKEHNNETNTKPNTTSSRRPISTPR